MKKLFALTAVVIAVISMLYFSANAYAGKAYLGSVDLDSEAGLVKSSMTFNYTFLSGFAPGNQQIEISNSTSFSSPVQVTLQLPHMSSITVDCSALSSGQAYWRITEGGTVISTVSNRPFTLP
jgi:hypothetical protein